MASTAASTTSWSSSLPRDPWPPMMSSRKGATLASENIPITRTAVLRTAGLGSDAACWTHGTDSREPILAIVLTASRLMRSSLLPTIL